MSRRQLRRRAENIEDRILPRSDGFCTLTELYWSIWRRNKKRFLEMAREDCALGVLIPGFERAEKGIMNERRKAPSLASQAWG